MGPYQLSSVNTTSIILERSSKEKNAVHLLESSEEHAGNTEEDPEDKGVLKLPGVCSTGDRLCDCNHHSPENDLRQQLL